MTKQDRICDACLTNPPVGVACSSLGPISFAYCRDCALSGREPWSAVVGFCFGCPVPLPFDIREGIVAEQLVHHNKTIEDLEADVAEVNKSYAEYCEMQREADHEVP